MKKFLTLALLCATLFAARAQSLTVSYFEQMKTSNVASIDNPQIRAAVEAKLRDMSCSTTLQSSAGKSLYKPPVGNSVYKDVTSDKLIMQDMIIDKQFLITDRLPQFGWVIEKEQKEILGKKCTKATSQDGNTTAWFCSEIPSNEGPKDYWGCPGLILEIETKAMTITAQSVELSKSTIESIKPPTTGKVISKKEFAELKTQKAKEQGAVSGGSNIQVIKM